MDRVGVDEAVVGRPNLPAEPFDSRAPSGRLLDLGPVTQGVAALLPGLGCRGPSGRSLLLKLLLFLLAVIGH